MKILSLVEANRFLEAIGMKIGSWGEISSVSGQQPWTKYHAPKEGLLSFSQYVAGWLGKSKWKIFQVDNSTGWMDPVQASFFGGLLFGGERVADINSLRERTFLFEFGGRSEENDRLELLVSNLIYVFLLFSSHGYVASDDGRVVGLQDEFVYLHSDEEGLSSAKAMLKNFAEHPSVSPQWVIDIIAKDQERSIADL
jgi:hypothetical protein